MYLQSYNPLEGGSVGFLSVTENFLRVPSSCGQGRL